jgi:hypothetical protein
MSNKMHNSRRKFLKTLAVGVIGGGVLYTVPSHALSDEGPKAGGFEIQKGFTVFNTTTQMNMERLAEALVPGSKSLGIKEKVMKVVRADKGTAGFLDAGFWHIDALSRNKYAKPFYKLENKEHINTLIKYISVKNRLFFNQFRNLVIKLYYSDPEAWRKLSYDGPPQPKGFMDYADAPEESKPSKKQSK